MEDSLKQGGYSMEDEIPQELLAPLSDEERDLDEIDRPSISYWRNCWLRLKKDKLAMFGLAVIIVITLLAVFVPMLSPYTYDQTDFAHMLEWPSMAHPFGTDKMGRDIFVRTMYGARISLTIGFAAAAINMVIGVFYGGIAGYLGGRTDMIGNLIERQFQSGNNWPLGAALSVILIAITLLLVKIYQKCGGDMESLGV